MNLTIAFTVSCMREKYLRQALDSWAKVRGIQEAHLLFCLEPRPRHSPFPVAEFQEFLRRSFRSTQVVVNHERFDCSRNTKAALERAFAGGADFTVLAEEDLVVSADVLEYFRWAWLQRDDAMQAVCAHAFSSVGSPSQVVRVSWFSPLVWGTWPDRWQDFIKPSWGGVPGNPEAWDACLRQAVIEARQACLFPALSRSQHIGQLSTQTPGSLADYFYKQSISQCFSAAYEPQQYQIVPRLPELQLTI